MSSERYPANLSVTDSDLDFDELETLLNESEEYGYSTYHSTLSKAAREAIETGNPAKGKGLWLLADACSMMLKPSSIHKPFEPFAVMGNRRSSIPEGFSAEDLEFFEAIIGKVDNDRLNARLADILWLLGSPRKVEHALASIEYYSHFSLDHDSLLRDGREGIERAIRLALMLRESAADKLNFIRTSLLNAFNAAKFDENCRALWLAELLEYISLEDADQQAIAEKLEQFANDAIANEDYYRARHFFEGAVTCNGILKNEKHVYELNVEIAETWVAEAEIRAMDSNMVAGNFYENAIKELRKIPNAHRPPFGIDERIAELHKKMNHSNQLALGEMEMIETPGVDIGECVENSQKQVSGKSLHKALIALAKIHSGASVERIRQSAEKGMQHSVLRYLCTATHLTRDGRVAGRSAGLDLGDPQGEESQQILREDMLRNLSIHVELATQATILPALHQINLEHRITEQVILQFCNASRLIPFGRATLWAKGLYHGFEMDFTLPTHLLIPQLEHLVRVQLKQADIKTSTLNAQGTETENGLSTLLDTPEAKDVLGEDLHFELLALLTDPLGANLRNEMAHGLLEADSANSLQGVYVWWICLKLLIHSISWKEPEKQENEQTETASNPSVPSETEKQPATEEQGT